MLQVRAATDEKLQSLTDDLLSCGYTGLINADRMDPITRTIILHSLARLLPVLDQMQKGLQLYNLLDVMEKNIDICRPLFVPLQVNKVKSFSCKPDFSEQGTTRHNLEQSLLNCFQDFLQELEDNGKMHVHLIPSVLQWLTGQGHQPVLPSERNNFEIHIKFNHACQQEEHEICFPIVSTCTKTVTFPVAHMSSYNEFKHVLTLALRFGNTFGRV
uniref:HECT domain-containing protein n=1 Tax=Monopterus albus TaxID=43700 RepID=A0A3Q3INX8_MONAL